MGFVLCFRAGDARVLDTMLYLGEMLMRTVPLDFKPAVKQLVISEPFTAQ